MSVLEGERVTAIKQEKAGGGRSFFEWAAISFRACWDSNMPWTRKCFRSLPETHANDKMSSTSSRARVVNMLLCGRVPIFIGVKSFYGFPAHTKALFKLPSSQRIPVDP